MAVREKRIYIEWMRIIACVLVIYNHTQAFYLYMDSAGISQAIYLTLSAITKINVPLFLMISGALLLGRDESYHHVLTRRALRIAVVIVLFEGVYCIFDYVKCVLSGVPYEDNAITIAYRIAGGRIDTLGPYWYLYAYLGFLLVLPFLQRGIQHMGEQDLRTFVLVLVVIRVVFKTIVPVMSMIYRMHGGDAFVLSSHLNVALSASDALFYPIMGYYLEHSIDIAELRVRHILCGLLLCAGCIMLTAWCTCQEYAATGAYSQSYMDITNYVLAIAAYILIKYAVQVRWNALLERRMGAIIAVVGSQVFGIYLLGAFYKLFAYSGFEYLLGQRLTPFWFSIAWIVTDMMVCGIAAYWLRKVPGIRQLL